MPEDMYIVRNPVITGNSVKNVSVYSCRKRRMIYIMVHSNINANKTQRRTDQNKSIEIIIKEH